MPHKKQSKTDMGIQKVLGISERNCFTDFHIDFTGTTAWLHVLQVKYCHSLTQIVVLVSKFLTKNVNFHVGRKVDFFCGKC